MIKRIYANGEKKLFHNRISGFFSAAMIDVSILKTEKRVHYTSSLRFDIRFDQADDHIDISKILFRMKWILLILIESRLKHDHMNIHIRMIVSLKL